MILITLIHGIYTIQHHTQPFRFVMRNDIRVISGKFCYIPGSVRLQIVFCDHVNTIFIAETVDWRCIRIMAGTNRIDVVLFHDHDVFEQFLPGHVSSCNGAELMAVHTLEYDTFSVEGHDTILHLKTAEANFLRDDLLEFSVFITDLQLQIIEIRLFRTPEKGILNLPGTGILSVERSFILQKDLALSGKCKLHFSFSPGTGHDLKLGFFESFIRNGTDPEIIYMDIRHCKQINISVNSGKTVKILILAPAAGCPFEHLRRQLVLAVLQIFRKLEF